MMTAFSTAFGYVAGAILGAATSIFIILLLIGLVLEEYPHLYHRAVEKDKGE